MATCNHTKIRTKYCPHCGTLVEVNQLIRLDAFLAAVKKWKKPPEDMHEFVLILQRNIPGWRAALSEAIELRASVEEVRRVRESRCVDATIEGQPNDAPTC